MGNIFTPGRVLHDLQRITAQLVAAHRNIEIRAFQDVALAVDFVVALGAIAGLYRHVHEAVAIDAGAADGGVAAIGIELIMAQGARGAAAAVILLGVIIGRAHGGGIGVSRARGKNIVGTLGA